MQQAQTELSREQAIRYLRFYNGEADWDTHINQVYSDISRKESDPVKAKELMRATIACTILLPFKDKSLRYDDPTMLLHKCRFYHQFTQTDWWNDLQKIITQDDQIVQWRNRCLALGIIDPIDYAPITRQAFNWLYERAEAAGAIKQSDPAHIRTIYQRLVWAYGGAVVCAIFKKEENKIRKIYNWNTNYFFEKLIFETFTLEEVLKIKHQELQKTNKKLVKQLQG